MGHRTLDYGLILPEDEELLPSVLLNKACNAVFNFSYSTRHPPNFRGFFSFLVSRFIDCDDIALLSKLISLLAHIAGYKMGVEIAKCYLEPQPILITLLSRSEVQYVKSAVDYFRKIVRVIGPKLIFREFISKNFSNPCLQRSLAVISHQIISDCPTYPFSSKDFSAWLPVLSQIPNLGDRVLRACSQAVPGIQAELNLPPPREPSPLPPRPPSVPKILPLPIQKSEKTTPEIHTRHQAPSSARPSPFRSAGFTSSFDDSLDSDFSQRSPKPIRTRMELTERQAMVREFVDEPFPSSNAAHDALQQSISSLKSVDWEAHAAAFHTMRRILRYHSSTVGDEEIHTLVTTALDDAGNQRAALALAAIAGIKEAFLQKEGDMESEVSRVFPVLLKLHAKNAQFFEEAITGCCNAIVQHVSSRRLLSVLPQCSENKSSKVQSAMARYARASIEKAIVSGEKLFPKNSKEIEQLVQCLWNLMTGAASSTRDDAKGAASALSKIYKEQFADIVGQALNTRDAGQFLRNAI